MKLYSTVYDYAIYTLYHYEDKYFTSLFGHFRHKANIYNQCVYTQIIIKKFNAKSFVMYFLREQF